MDLHCGHGSGIMSKGLYGLMDKGEKQEKQAAGLIMPLPFKGHPSTIQHTKLETHGA